MGTDGNQLCLSSFSAEFATAFFSLLPLLPASMRNALVWIKSRRTEDEMNKLDKQTRRFELYRVKGSD